MLKAPLFAVSAIAFAMCVLPSFGNANTLLDADFEQAEMAHWTPGGPSGSFQQVSEDRSGGKAIKFTAGAPTTATATLAQTVSVSPCRKYSLSVWIRTDSVTSTSEAGTVSVDWVRNGTVLRTSTAAGPKGTGAWRQWNVDTLTAPALADSAIVKLYVGAGTAGTVWWDDIEFSQVKDALFGCILIEPNYRGWTYGSYPASIRAKAIVNYSDYGLTPAELKLTAKLVNPTTGEALRTVTSDITGVENTIDMPRPIIAPGSYTLSVSLTKRATGELLGSADYPIVRLASSSPSAKCWIDQYNRLIVDGKPFFPLGLYTWVKDTEADLKTIADAGFNTVLPYERYNKTIDQQKALFTASRNLGLKTIYGLNNLFDQLSYWPSVNGLNGWNGEEALVRGFITTFKDEPGIIAWYLSDEPWASWATDLVTHYDIARELDPDHPCSIVVFKPEELRDFTKGFDVYGTDCYPVSWAPIDWAGATASAASDQIYGARPAWHVPQLCNLKIYSPDSASERPPTYAEMRNMAYQDLCAGATGLIFYQYDDVYRDPGATAAQRWADAKKLADEFRPMIPELLSTQQPMDLTVSGSNVSHFSKCYDNKTHLYLVNTSTLSATATVTLPRPVQTVKVNGVAVTPDANKQVKVTLAAIGIAEVEVQDYPWTRGSGTGLSTQGLLVRTTGKVTSLDSSSFLLDDGSNAWVKVVLPAGVTLPAAGSHIMVTGISACEKVEDKLGRVLNVRSSGDLRVVQSD